MYLFTRRSFVSRFVAFVAFVGIFCCVMLLCVFVFVVSVCFDVCEWFLCCLCCFCVCVMCCVVVKLYVVICFGFGNVGMDYDVFVVFLCVCGYGVMIVDV